MTSLDNDQRRHDESGFTLIELLIVIVVLAILAAVVIFALGGVTGQSAISACNSDVKTVETAIQAYQTQNGSPPAAQTDLTGTANGGPYLKTWPNNGTHYAIAFDPSNGNVWVAPNIAQATLTTDMTGTGVAPYNAFTASGTTWEPYDTYTNSTTNGNICSFVK